MNTPLDFELCRPSANCPAAVATFGCCTRYSPGIDQAPALIALALDGSERVARRLGGWMRAALQAAAYNRQ